MPILNARGTPAKLGQRQQIRLLERDRTDMLATLKEQQESLRFFLTVIEALKWKFNFNDDAVLPIVKDFMAYKQKERAMEKIAERAKVKAEADEAAKVTEIIAADLGDAPPTPSVDKPTPMTGDDLGGKSFFSS